MKRLLLLPLAALLVMGQGGRGPVRDPRGDQPAGTAVIRGRILAADTSTPIRRAQVRASTGGSNRGARLVSTDAEGRFELRDLPAGRWDVTASKAGYVTLQYTFHRYPFEAKLFDTVVYHRENCATRDFSALNRETFRKLWVYVNVPRAVTSLAASSKVSTPARWAAVSSPMECPARKSGRTPNASTSRNSATSNANTVTRSTSGS